MIATDTVDRALAAALVVGALLALLAASRAPRAERKARTRRPPAEHDVKHV